MLVVVAGADRVVETVGRGVVANHGLVRAVEAGIAEEEVVEAETRAAIGTDVAVETGGGNLVIEGRSMSLNMIGNLEVRVVGRVISM